MLSLLNVIRLSPATAFDLTSEPDRHNSLIANRHASARDIGPLRGQEQLLKFHSAILQDLEKLAHRIYSLGMT